MSNLAFVFPGQGSQEVGMLADNKSAVSATFNEASEALGYDLWSLVQRGPTERLNLTEFTQPALLTASIALWRLAEMMSVPAPAIVAGHSLGEYSALVAAGVLEFNDAVKLVSRRGQFMQSAVPEGLGGMAAILGLDDDKVVAICAESAGQGVVEAANFNSPGQVVIAGDNTALNTAVEACKAAGAKRVMPLSASAPFHCSLMKPAADQMRDVLADVAFKAPRMKIIQNVDASFHESPEDIRDNLVKQMCGAVRWTETVQLMAAQEADQLLECGPGKVLSGLNRRIDKSLKNFNIDSEEAIRTVLTEIRV